MRVIVPPMANQILGLAKNTSLGVAIAYPELVAITRTVVNQTGHALEMMAIVFAFFLSLNLMITTIFNYINHRLRIVER
jgi:general L-amino acid transport system permease protein